MACEKPLCDMLLCRDRRTQPRSPRVSASGAQRFREVPAVGKQRSPEEPTEEGVSGNIHRAQCHQIRTRLQAAEIPGAALSSSG